MPINSASHLLNFKSTLDAEGGPISPARYIFSIGGYPKVLVRQDKYRQKAGKFLRSLRYLCDMCDIPGLTIRTNQREGYGPDMQAQMPTGVEFGQLTISIICRDYMSEKEFFDDWMFSIKNMHRGGVGPTFDNAYYNDIVVDGQIYVMSHYNQGKGHATDIDEAEQIRYAINIANMYPINMDSIAMSWQEDASMKLNMTFTYSRWEPIIGQAKYAHSFPANSFATPPTRQLLNYIKPRG